MDELGRAKLEPSAPAKFGYALIQLGFGFLILDWGARGVGLQNMTPVIFIFLLYLFHTTGELCLSPVGLSAMNRLAPKHLASFDHGYLVLRIRHRQLCRRRDRFGNGIRGKAERIGKA